ncbi:thiamine pyrophosphate-dependent dehydrogenase E1 component subunit alpha [Candidatus Woesearchaeota archaeon]|nr:thiamine pyrophosphate-dependent dehydrogenase E1 component subunit alpha [Candidatus Woesearchaeota archaeon]
MLKIRYFEEKIDFLFSRGKIHGTAHSCIGQEAVAVGACAALKKTDFITSTHRGHGHAIAKGLDIKRFMAELAGKATGYCAGRGGTQHSASIEHGFLTNGITGGMSPVAAGLALSFRMKKTGQVVLCFFGDGAVNEGHVQETLNISAVWNLPIVFICENNLYAMSTPVKEAMSVKDIAKRAESYGMQGYIIDGNDLLLVKRITEEAVENARKGNGPSFIECKTYRWKGHSKNDRCMYRTREEENEWKLKDPIQRFREKLLHDNIAGEKDLDIIEEKAKDEVEKAADFALSSPETKPDTLYDNLYA